MSATGTTPAPQAAPPTRAWTDADLARDPHRDADKPAKVRAMFAAIARSYDLNNRVHSVWQDQRWRRFAVRIAEIREGDEVLDCACGTGDLSLAFARARAHTGSGHSQTLRCKRVVGLDFTAEMLDIARSKSTAASRPKHLAAPIEYVRGDAQALPFADGSFDVVSIAFGLRNVQDPARAVHEFRRVLRPGGRLIVLEFAEPRCTPVRWFNDLYCRRIMPTTATWISGDRTGAYRYLPKSVQTFMNPESLRNLMTEAGFAGARDWALSMGICRCYRAFVPSARRR